MSDHNNRVYMGLIEPSKLTYFLILINFSVFSEYLSCNLGDQKRKQKEDRQSVLLITKAIYDTGYFEKVGPKIVSSLRPLGII